MFYCIEIDKFKSKIHQETSRNILESCRNLRYAFRVLAMRGNAEQYKGNIYFLDSYNIASLIKRDPDGGPLGSDIDVRLSLPHRLVVT